jgi:hypothetical protein
MTSGVDDHQYPTNVLPASNQRATQNLFHVEGWMHMPSKSSTITRNLMPLVTPGEILKEDFMAPFGLSANALGLELHVPPNRILAIVKGNVRLRPIRLFACHSTSVTLPSFGSTCNKTMIWMRRRGIS